MTVSGMLVLGRKVRAERRAFCARPVSVISTGVRLNVVTEGEYLENGAAIRSFGSMAAHRRQQIPRSP